MFTLHRGLARLILARRGYAAVVVDVRGRYESEGVFTAWTHDGRDAYDTVTWAADQPWSNGRIGTWGRSYGGLVQWQLAHLGHPNVCCIAPQVIHDDYFWDGYWTGGAFQLALTLGAATLWTSALSLITGPSARDVVLNDRIFGHLHHLSRADELTKTRKLRLQIPVPVQVGHYLPDTVISCLYAFTGSERRVKVQRLRGGS